MEYYIKRVRVKGLFNPNNSLNVDFEKDLNCIYGYNGTGKTVLINLIVHALNSNIKELSRIPFQQLTILISKKKQPEKFITVTNSMEGIQYIFHCSQDDLNNRLKNRYPFHRKSFSLEREVPYHVASRTPNDSLKLRITPIYVRTLIQSFISITFVPLFRASRNVNSASSHSTFEINDQDKNSVLTDIQDEFAKQYASAQSNIARKLETLSSDILSKLFLSSSEAKYNLYEDEIQELIKRGQPYNYQITMEKVKAQIKDLNLNIPISVIEDHYNAWFKVQKELIDAHSALDRHSEQSIEALNRYSSAYISFAATLGMYKKLQEAISLIEHVYHKKYLALNKFENFKYAINDFLSENKNFSFDDDGTFRFTHNGNPVKLEHLSSGEQQLIAILGRLCTANELASTFITDEPELSLHLDWQRKILPTIKELSPDTQIIVATHSPAIISDDANMVDIEDCYKHEDGNDYFYE
ncbi:AAA family ATPase [Vibrio cholerae]|nr:AAA family ATPase [Vibrio cholerae]EJL6912814.1 AAA family ATPase [Vibrio cholerae]EJO4004602.1 AAA family ATPase [Vibrio cholerae]